MHAGIQRNVIDLVLVAIAGKFAAKFFDLFLVVFTETGRIDFDTLQRFRILQFAESLEWKSDLGFIKDCLLYTSPSPRDRTRSRMPSSA